MGTAEVARSHREARKREIKGRSRDQKAENLDKVDFLWNDWMLGCPMGLVGRIYSAYGRCVGSADYWETNCPPNLPAIAAIWTLFSATDKQFTMEWLEVRDRD